MGLSIRPGQDAAICFCSFCYLRPDAGLHAMLGIMHVAAFQGFDSTLPEPWQFKLRVSSRAYCCHITRAQSSVVSFGAVLQHCNVFSMLWCAVSCCTGLKHGKLLSSAVFALLAH